MSKKTDLGIYVKKTKTFYYLEYGDNYVNNTLDRVKKTLLQRNVITGMSEPNSREVQYEIISYKKAHDSSLEMQPVFISRHVQALYNKTNAKAQEVKGTFK